MLDNPIYRVCIEDSKHPGYVKVRCIDDPSIFSTKTLSTAERLSPRAISEGEEEEEVEEEVEERPGEMTGPRRRSYDEPSPRVTPPVHRPAAAVMRSRSFEPIVEDVETEGPQPDFMKNLEKHVREVFSSDNYLKPRQFGPSVKEISRTGMMSPPLATKADGVSPPILKGQISPLVFPSNYQQAAPAQFLAPPPTSGADGGSRRSSAKRGSAGSTSDYGYVTVKDLPLPPEEKYSRDSIISNNCFLHRDVAILEEDEEEDQPYPLGEEMEKRIYLSSRRMMLFFSNQFYEIARRLGKAHLTSSARLLAPNILCREMMENSYKEQSWYYMPSIEIPFVPDQYFEYFLRKRPTMIHKITRVKYQWPSQPQLNDIRRLGCNIAPVR